MTAVGIIAEYDPFHTGHACHIEQTRRALGGDAAVIAVMSGCWVQRAGPAVADKWTRARMALLGGVDLVLELPTVWAVSTAERFARGSVALLHAAGVVDVLSFGSECGKIQPLQQVAQCLNSLEYREALGQFTDKGISFAVSRQEAVREVLGEEYAGILSHPNNNLGVEYLRALDALGSPIRPLTVRREGAGHGDLTGAGQDAPFVSASWIRERLWTGRQSEAEPYLLPGTSPLLPDSPAHVPDLARVERAVLAKIRVMSTEGWSALPDSGAAEGLPQRLARAGRQCVSLEEFYTLAKTRRYTHARLRRLVLWAYLGLTAADVPPDPPYLRVLGFNSRGQALLREMKGRATLPVLTKPAHAKDLDEDARRLFELEARCTDLYDLCLEVIPTPGREWTTGPVQLN